MASQAITTTKSEARPPAGTEHTRTRRVFRPRVDILETGQNILLVADMPGVDEKSADVSVEKNVLTIKGTVDWSPPAGHEELYREYATGDYQRAFTLSDEVDPAGIQAQIKDGVLHLVLPKVAPSTKKIAVKAG